MEVPSFKVTEGILIAIRSGIPFVFRGSTSDQGQSSIELEVYQQDREPRGPNMGWVIGLV